MRFMSCGEKGLVRTWEWVRTTRSGKQLSTQASPKGLTSALPSLTQLMRCGDQLLGVTDDQNLHLLDPSSLHLERTIVGYNDEITDLRIVPAEAASESSVSGLDDALVAVATNSEQIRLFSVATMGCELLLGHSDIVLALDVHPRRRWLASSSKDATVRIWDLGSAECIGSCVGHMEAVGAVAFGGDAELVSGSKDKTLKRWDLTALIPKAERAKPGKSSKQVEQTRRANKSHTQVAHTGRTQVRFCPSATPICHTPPTHSVPSMSPGLFSLSLSFAASKKAKREAELGEKRRLQLAEKQAIKNVRYGKSGVRHMGEVGGGGRKGIPCGSTRLKTPRAV